MIDYAQRGVSISAAFLEQARRVPKEERPDYVLWGGSKVQTGDRIPVPRKGRVRGEFLSAKPVTEQGFDMKVKGWLELAAGERVSPLRTWYDEKYEATVEYPFSSRDGLLLVWNVYKMHYPGGQIVEEKWTGNAGFIVEQIGERDRIYHCSPGNLSEPDFESLVFRISILE